MRMAMTALAVARLRLRAEVREIGAVSDGGFAPASNRLRE